MITNTSAGVDQYVVILEEQLRNISTILRKRGRDILANFEITPPQLDALLVLKEHGQLTMGELCQKMFLACSTATDLIDRMERNQLIERVRDTNDRRVIRLRVLPKGTRIIDEVLEARRKYLTSLLNELEVSDKERFVKTLEQLNCLMNREVQ